MFSISLCAEIDITSICGQLGFCGRMTNASRTLVRTSLLLHGFGLRLQMELLDGPGILLHDGGRRR